MKYEFIKIVDTDEGQMAYMLDHDRGVIVVAPVEFLGEKVERPARRRVEEREEWGTDDEVVVRPRRRARVIDPEDIELNEEDRGGKDVRREERAPTKPVTGRPRSIVPSHLRGIFLKPGKQGADTEVREF